MLKRLAAFAVLLLLCACVSVDDVEPPTVNLVDLSIGKPGLLSQTLLLTVRVGNPNDFDIPLQGLTLKVAINGREIADGLSDEETILPRLGYATVRIDATASTFGLLRELIAFDGRDELKYQISGKAIVDHPLGRRAVPYKRDGTLSLLPKIPAPRDRRAPQRRAPPNRDDTWRTFRSI